MPLLIPIKDHPILARLLLLPKARATSLAKALQGSPPALSVRKLARRISNKIGLDENKAFLLLNVIVKIYEGFRQSRLKPEEFLEEFRETLAEMPKLKFSENEWSHRKRFLLKMLECEDSIGVTAKALRVMTDHEKVFKDARILTDFRPVFKSDPKAPPAAAVIIHTLKIEFAADSEGKKFFVALDSNDIDHLSELVKRARLKEAALKQSLHLSQIQILEP